MIMSRTFVYADGSNSNFGEDGFLPAWMKNVEGFDPGFGLSIAHDFFEHRLCDNGRWSEECMAFGAMIYTRGRNGYFKSYGDGTDEPGLYRLGEELAQLWFDAHKPPMDDSPGNIRQTQCEDFMRLSRYMKAGFREGMEQICPDNNEEVPSDFWFEQAGRWFSYGYYQAQRRYHRLERGVLEAFNQVQESTTRAALQKMMDFDYGDRLVIKVNDRFGMTPEVSITLNRMPVRIRT